MTFDQRPYQQKVIADVKESLNAGKNTLISLPTGSGKAYIICQVASDLLAAFPSFRVLILVDRQILITQLAETMRQVNDKISIGFACAGVDKIIDTDKQVTIATRQSIINHLDLCRPFNLLIGDEAHLWRLQKENAPPDGQFAKIYHQCLENNPKLRLLGCSATCFTLQSGYIYGDKHKAGLSPYFMGLASTVTFKELIADEYLAKAKGEVIDDKLNLEDIALVSGEYNLGQLSQVMIQHVSSVKQAIDTLCEGRESILVFAVDIAHCEAIQAVLPGSTVLHSKLSKDDHIQSMSLFTQGNSRIMISVNQVSIGFDHKPVDTIILARPTKAPALATQMIGRGLRTSPGKEDCLVIDLVGITSEHYYNYDFDKPIIKIPKSNGENGEAPFKQCPECAATLHPAVRICPKCGHEWTVEEVEALLPQLKKVEFNELAPPTWFDIIDSVIEIHLSQKSGKYLGRIKMEVFGLSRGTYVAEYFCFQDFYEGGAIRAGESKWVTYCNDPYPDSVEEFEFLEDSIKIPTRILIDESKQFPEIIGHEFEPGPVVEVEELINELSAEVPF